MMVSKVAVMALVAVIAVPILLGYALNLNETTEIDWKTTGDSVNVTPLLINDNAYSYVNADVYQLNTKFRSDDQNQTIPIYNKISAYKTSYPLAEDIDTNQSWSGSTQSVDYAYFYEQFDYDPATNDHQLEIYGSINGGAEQLITTVQYIHSIYYNKADSYYRYTYYYGVGSIHSNYGDAQLTKVIITTISGVSDVYTAYTSSSKYADFSAGYTFKLGPSTGITGENYGRASVSLPNSCKTAIITVDLSSITENNYATDLGVFYLEKTTTGGVVTWMVKPRPGVVISQTIDPIELYYDQTTNNNTYQIKIWTEDQPDSNGDYARHFEFRYVGKWPSVMGEANYYNSFDIQYKTSATHFSSMVIGGGYSSHTPTIRVDAAQFKGTEYQIINDQTYDPSSFKINPSTTISNPQIYGSSIEFGGNTYAVTNGNITMGTHQVPVKGLVLSSTPNAGGGYDNKIGNTIISITEDPSTITFNGKWSASISTTAQESYTYTKTEWIAGEFAWDGIDQNFLIVGLITCLGAFVALGIYARKSRSGGIIPLMIVMGCAAAVFFIMI